MKPDDTDSDDTDEEPVEIPRPAALPFVAVFALLFILVTLTVFAGPVMEYTNATAQQLFEPSAYIDAVLGRPES